MKPVVKVIQLGKLNYLETFKIQSAISFAIINYLKSHQSCLDWSQIANTLILVEHNPVYTIGLRTKDYSDEFRKKLILKGAEFVTTNRGGLITFHGFGQLTAYPILYLGCFLKNKSVRHYVHLLEQSILETCQDIILTKSVSRIEEYPGIWIEGERKIAAIGINVKRYVTTHGFSINCNIDLSWFDDIIPCGIPGKKVTSVSSELGYNFSVQDMIPKYLNSFRKVFNCDLV